MVVKKSTGVRSTVNGVPRSAAADRDTDMATTGDGGRRLTPSTVVRFVCRKYCRFTLSKRSCGRLSGFRGVPNARAAENKRKYASRLSVCRSYIRIIISYTLRPHFYDRRSTYNTFPPKIIVFHIHLN